MEVTISKNLSDEEILKRVRECEGQGCVIQIEDDETWKRFHHLIEVERKLLSDQQKLIKDQKKIWEIINQ